MGITELIIIAIGLSMDAFAVSIGKGLALPRVRYRHALCAGLWFGGFQALMPVAGYLLGSAFASFVKAWDHWISFILLAYIGINMIKEAFESKEESKDKGFAIRIMFLLAVATSIDALAVGVSLAFLNASILSSAMVIGFTTFLFSAVGVYIGNLFGNRYRKTAECIGGVILIVIGIKILIEHLLA